MGIVKIIILGLLVWIGFRLFRAIQQRKSLASKSVAKQISEDLVKCAACGTHIPKDIANLINGKFYFKNKE